MELSLGFGCNVSSNYAQRFAHEIVRLLSQRFDAKEAAILDAETDPSRRACGSTRAASSARSPATTRLGCTRSCDTPTTRTAYAFI